MAFPTIDFRKAAIALAIIGAILGVAFGVGVAYGRGSPKTVDSGMSQAQIAQLLGLGGGTGTGTGTGSAGGGGFAGGGGGGAAFSNLFGGGTAGLITALTDTTITIETRQGTHTVNLSPTTIVQTYAKTDPAALKAGDVIIVTGDTAADGSIAATDVSQLPDALKTLASGTTGSNGPGGATGATGTNGTNGNRFRSGATGATAPTGSTAPAATGPTGATGTR